MINQPTNYPFQYAKQELLDGRSWTVVVINDALWVGRAGYNGANALSRKGAEIYYWISRNTKSDVLHEPLNGNFLTDNKETVKHHRFYFLNSEEAKAFTVVHPNFPTSGSLFDKFEVGFTGPFKHQERVSVAAALGFRLGEKDGDERNLELWIWCRDHLKARVWDGTGLVIFEDDQDSILFQLAHVK